MPELSRFFGIIISLRYNDDGKHHLPHIHATYAGYEAVVSFDGELLQGALPKTQLSMVIAWVTIHRSELDAAWIKASRNEKIDKIKPLK